MLGSGRWGVARRPQRLQIGEICDAAREFLDSKRIVGLEQSYLPSGLRVKVAAGDLASLKPFETELQQALQAIVDGLARRPSFCALSSVLTLDLVSEPGRTEGAAPGLVAGYPPGEREVHWLATRGDDERSAAGNLEVVFTSIASGQTGAQERCGIVLDEIPEATETQSGKERRLAVANPFARSPVPGARCPSALDQPDLRARSMSASGTEPPSVWADDGVLLIGRDGEFSHLVPTDAPPTMSRRHCALIAGRDGDLHVVDLGSGNGTSVGGEPCHPFKPVRLTLPAVLAIGQPGRFQIEVVRT